MLSFVKADIDIALGEQLITIRGREVEKAKKHTSFETAILDTAKDFL